MEILRHFAYCPGCGASATPAEPLTGPFRCGACGFTLFFNAAAAVAALILRSDGYALFIRRAKDPGKGKLGLPGGFVDPGEDAETALAREVREEVGLELTALHYLSSHANRYLYAGVTYTTLDLFYLASARSPDGVRALDAVESVEWLDPETVDRNEIAFDSMRAALDVYRGISTGFNAE
jgi:ADP-ribose pyrophosphatase YjhB (NUDIX family)